MPASIDERLSRIAFQIRMAAPQLDDVLKLLDSLTVLDQNLDQVEQSFDLRYAADVKPVDVEIRDQLIIYKKALDGLEKAKAARDALEGLLKIHPDEKAAQRAMEEADRLIKKYERHSEVAKKIVSTAAKKTMPPNLKKMVADVYKAIKDKLVAPDALDVTPWEQEVDVYVGRQTMRGVAYSVAFELPGVLLPKDSDESFGRPPVPETIRWDLGESFSASRDGVPTLVYKSSKWENGEAKSAQVVVDAFLKTLRGWNGIKGEGESLKKRKEVAQSIGHVLTPIARAQGSIGMEGPTISPVGDYVSIGYRRYEKEHGDRERQRPVIERELAEVSKQVDRALASYKTYIKNTDIGLGDKGWVEINVTLK